MHSWLATGLMQRVVSARRALALVTMFAALAFALPLAHAQQGQTPTSQAGTMTQGQAANSPSSAPAQEAGGEANLKLPDLSSVSFLNGINGSKLLAIGLVFCALGLLFG